MNETRSTEHHPAAARAPAAPSASIPLVDVKKDYRDLREEIDRAVLETLASGEYCLGSQVTAFEAEVADYLGVPAKHAIGVSSGTDALLLALTEVGVGPDDEVISPAFTFIATATGIARLGARPVFADIEPGGFQMDPAKLARAVTPRTRAVIPVHLYGAPAPLEAYRDALRGREIAMIEDACQAIGARIGGKAVGTLGEYGCYSFYPTKNLPACGDAGLLVTNDARRADRVRSLRAHGVEQGSVYHHALVGMNARLDGVQAAILRVRLKRLESWNEGRRQVARRYDAAFEASGVLRRDDPRGRGPAVRTFAPPAAGRVSNGNQYAIRASRRDELKARLAERGIATAVYYPMPLPLQPAFRHLGHRPGDFPAAEALSREVLCLPTSPSLMPQDIERVVGEIESFYR